MFKRFQTKLALFFTALFLILQGVAIYTVQQAIVQNIFDQSRDQLIAANRIFTSRVAATVNALADGTRILASDFGFRTAVATNDSPTILSALNNLGARIAADRVMLVDLDYLVTADTGNPSSEPYDFPFFDLIDVAEEQSRAESIAVLDGAIYEFVVMPVLAPVPIAWIAIAVEIDQPFAHEFRQESTLPLEVTFATGQVEAGWVASVSTLNQVARTELPAAMVSQGEMLIGDTKTLTLGGSDYVTLVANLATTTSAWCHVSCRMAGGNEPGRSANCNPITSSKTDMAVRVNAGCCKVNGWIGLNPDASTEGPYPNC